MPLQPMKAILLPLCSMSNRQSALLWGAATAIILPALSIIEIKGMQGGCCPPITEMVSGEFDHIGADILKQFHVFVRTAKNQTVVDRVWRRAGFGKRHFIADMKDICLPQHGPDLSRGMQYAHVFHFVSCSPHQSSHPGQYYSGESLWIPVEGRR